VGSKNDLMDHRVRINTSLFLIDWSNIQQVIGLSGCGFAYTSNLGKARSQGMDFQADLALAKNLVAGIAFGYNDAKFTQTVTSPAGGRMVTDGDHIFGWPWSLGISAQYNFHLFQERGGYLRLDYQYQARQSTLTSGNNPENGSYTPWGVFSLPKTSQLSLRAGVKLAEWDVSLFCNNLTGDHAILSSSPSPNFGFPGGLVGYEQSTFRPRTYGVTVTYRH